MPALEEAVRPATPVMHRCRYAPFAIGRDGGKLFFRNRCACGRWEHPNDPDVIAYDNGEVVQRDCPVGCGRTARPGHLMCGPCWAEVPRELQRDVYRTWRALQATRSRARQFGKTKALEDYQAARDAAIASVA